MSAPSPLTRRREYEAYLRGPALAVTDRFGSFDRYWQGAQYFKGLTVFPEPQDAAPSEFGIQESGQVQVQIAATGPGDEDGTYDRLFVIQGSFRNQLVDLDLVTRIYREDGSSVEIVNERRGMVKELTRRQNVLSMKIADLDRAGLDALFPSKLYTVADWPELFVDHVGRAIPQGVGTVLKVPLTYVVKTGGVFKYSAAEVTADGAPAVLTLYRDGRIVSPVEYATATQVVGGTTHFLVTFAKEQLDFNGRLYDLSADLLFPGSRFPAHRVKATLEIAGYTVIADSFAAAADYHNAMGIRGDYGYVTQLKLSAILEDQLQLARGQLYRDGAGAFGMRVDRPRVPRVALDDQIASHETSVTEYTLPELAKTITLKYRPKTSQKEDLAPPLTRLTTGNAGQKDYSNRYIRDHDVADRHLCYLAKREKNRAEAKAIICGVQLAAIDVIALDSALNWSGTKRFAAPAITRPADANSVGLVEYVEDTYIYTAPGAGETPLPADATNGYTPDYSQTPPVAPTGLQIVSQGYSADTDGKVTSYALVRAVPPAVNWARLMAQLTDTTTGETYQAELLLVAGNYESRIGGLRPNRLHSIVCWAVNATDMNGATASIANFTSANAVTALAAPTVTISQPHSKQVNVQLSAVADVAGEPKFRRNVLFEKVGAGSFAEVARSPSRVITRVVTHGTAYQYKARSEDVNGNESADSGTVSITPSAQVDDSHIIGQGVGGGSIANGAINTTRTNSATGSTSGSITVGTIVEQSLVDFMFDATVFCTSAFSYLDLKAPTGSSNSVAFQNNLSGTVNYQIDYRYVHS